MSSQNKCPFHDMAVLQHHTSKKGWAYVNCPEETCPFWVPADKAPSVAEAVCFSGLAMTTGECIRQCLRAIWWWYLASWDPWWQNLQLRTVLWVCRELVRTGTFLDQQVDPIVVCEDTMERPGNRCSCYVVYVSWMHDTYGPDRASHILRTLEIRHPHHVLRICILLARWALSPGCRRNAPPL